jgi:pantothenate kinase type III
MKAYLDIGHSFIKFEINSVVESYVTSEENLELVFAELKKNKVETVYLSNVVFKLWNLLTEFGKSIKCIPIREKITREDKRFNIASTDELGSDIGAMFFAATEKYHVKNGIFVSLGTAYTINLIQDSIYEGVIIYPSAHRTFDSFFKQLDDRLTIKYEPEREFKTVIGKNNKTAIVEPIIIGQWKLVEEAITTLKAQYQIDSIIFTGGDITLYKDVIAKMKAEIVPNLVIAGLKSI